ncbi:MAG: von Willebrand factor type A domain-containing protein [Flavobacteriales bacterium]|nr:von Willebrand factor type A domain-containing protein [Flavobacteriales bacterium]
MCTTIIQIQAQSAYGSIRGKLTDGATGETLPFVNIEVSLRDSIIAGGSTDFNGLYYIKGIPMGIYDITATFIGYPTLKTTDIIITEGLHIVDLKLTSGGGIKLDEVMIVSFKIPLIDKKGGSSCVVSGESLRRMPGRGVASNPGRIKSIRGARSSTPVTTISQPYHATLNTEEYIGFSDNTFASPFKEPLSTFSIDVDATSYSNIRRMINYGTYPRPDAVRIEEMVNYFNYDYPNPEGEYPFSITTEVASAPWNPEHKLVHIGLQGKQLNYDEINPSNLVFLIDVSGSMGSQNKLPLLKSSMKLLINKLDDRDRVAIVVYAGAAGLVLPSTPVSEKQKIIDALDNLRSGGSTAGARGIRLAYKVAKENLIEDGNNRIILATDGDFNVGVSSNTELVSLIEEKRNDGIFLTIAGFGMGNYKDGRMEQISNAGNGNYYYIDNIREAQKVFVTEMRSTLFTIAKDVKIQVEFNPEHVQSYRLIGYVNRMLEAEDFNNDKKDAGELGAGHMVTALYEIIPVGVNSSFSKSIDRLKYQLNVEKKDIDPISDELLTVKFRYKKPDEDTSRLIVKTLNVNESEEMPSENFRFSAAVAQYGMILRNSEFKADANYNNVLELAKGAKGEDKNGYRMEFIKMVQSSVSLAKN